MPTDHHGGHGYKRRTRLPAIKKTVPWICSDSVRVRGPRGTKTACFALYVTRNAYRSPRWTRAQTGDTALSIDRPADLFTLRPGRGPRGRETACFRPLRDEKRLPITTMDTGTNG